MTALNELTLAEARDGLKAKDFSATDLAKAHLSAIEAARGLNAYLLETPDRALQMAEVSDAKIASGEARPLEGLPLGVKDLFCTEGVPSQAGSKIIEGYRPPYTATVVKQLADAGAPLLGKTNQDEFAMGSSNENSAYGPVLNPWDRSRVPGGSSGGSAAAVAAGLAPWALGSFVSSGNASDVESFGSSPVMWLNSSAQSVTSRVSGPAWSSDEAKAIIP